MNVEEAAVEAISHLQRTHKSLASSGDGIGRGKLSYVHSSGCVSLPDESDQNEESDDGTQTKPHKGKAGKVPLLYLTKTCTYSTPFTCS